MSPASRPRPKFQGFHRRRSLDGVDRKPRRTAGRAARQIQGPGAGGACKLASRKLDAEPVSACICRHSRRAAGDARLPVRRQGRQGAGARNAAANWPSGKTPTYLGPDSPPLSIAGCPACASMCSARRATRRCSSSRRRADEMYRLAARSGWPLERALSAGLAADADGFGAPADDYSAPFDRNLGTDLAAALAGADGQRHRPLRRRSLCRARCNGCTGAREEARKKPPDENLTRPVLAAHRRRLAGHRRRSRHAARPRRQQHQPGAGLRVHRQRPRRCCSPATRRSATG